MVEFERHTEINVCKKKHGFKFAKVIKTEAMELRKCKMLSDRYSQERH